MSATIHIICLNSLCMDYANNIGTYIKKQGFASEILNSKEYSNFCSSLYDKNSPLHETYKDSKFIFLGMNSDVEKRIASKIKDWKFSKFGCLIGWIGNFCIVSASASDVSCYQDFRSYCTRLNNKKPEIIVPPESAFKEKIGRVNILSQSEGLLEAQYSVVMHEFTTNFLCAFLDSKPDDGEGKNHFDLISTKPASIKKNKGAPKAENKKDGDKNNADKDMQKDSNIRLIALLEVARENDPKNELLLEIYKRHDKHTPEELVEELRADGSNTIGRIATGSVDYGEVVKRVATKLKIEKKDLSDDEVKNELLIVRKALQDYIKKNPGEEEKLLEAAKELGTEGTDFINILMKGSASAFLIMAQRVGPYIIWRSVALVMLQFAGVQTALTVARIATLAVPFLNVVMGAWLIFDISGPAYRKIIPSVLNIALLRLQVMGEAK